MLAWRVVVVVGCSRFFAVMIRIIAARGARMLMTVMTADRAAGAGNGGFWDSVGVGAFTMHVMPAATADAV